jgi:Ferritin-like domain
MMDFNRDEVRRQLVDTSREHTDSLPGFAEALKRLFDPDQPVPAAVKAGALGVPSRRTFLTIGGIGVVGSAVLAACGQSPANQVAQTGTTPVQPSSTTTTAPGSTAMNMVLLRTAQSLEALAVSAYTDILAKNVVTSADVKTAMSLFREQHQDHANLLATATTDNGGEPFTKPNPYLDYEVLQPTLKSVKDQAAALTLATAVENVAVSTYVQAGGVLTTQNLRAAIMSIGATEGRHLTVLYVFQQTQPVPLSIQGTAGAAPANSYIGPDGPVDKHPPTPTTVAAS